MRDTIDITREAGGRAKQRKSISRADYERMIEKTRNKIRSRSKDVTVIQ
jgi:hypothetical protein